MTNTAPEDYLRILKEEFHNRKQKNSKYSMRAFAKYLGVSHALLSLVFLKKKGLSLKTAEKISSKLSLSHYERSIFISSVEKCFSRSEKKKSDAGLALIQLKRKKQFKSITPETVTQLDHWAYIAAFEAIYSEKAQTLKDISFFLDQKPSLIAKVLTYLQEISAISEENGVYTALSSSLHTTNDIPATSMVNYHISIAQKSIEAIKHQPVHMREYQNTILTVSPESIGDAKKMIRNFIHEFNTRFYVDNNSTQIYSLLVSFFKMGRE